MQLLVLILALGKNQRKLSLKLRRN